ncbi:FAD-dependent monooxygenase [Glycomyces buryatensis]|uniref:FAD-dependent oxidoreductase n=1 Tax=Glycomyces buryatensis TaxID=2570927 RepID=A0A4S8QHX8_9ACTN|nr:FAD-dependent monooxygenase [Glycomyces buryatensis]THV42852.1 FAD-dependent oxidoreductase [Glycomyces buryatensis]
MSDNRRVLISGASIAGTTAAYWLHRHGFTPTVIERAPAIREGGYKIDIRGAALDVVSRMDLLEEVRRHPTEVKNATIVDARGRKVASLDADGAGGREIEDAEIMRGDLNRIIYEATKADVEYRFEESISAIEVGDDSVKVDFESGSAEEFDLVIGADGAHSNTRSLAFGPETDYLHDLGYYVAIFSVPNHLGLDREELTYVGPGRTALTYSTAGDTGAKAMFMFASDPLEYDHRDRNRQQRLLSEAYAGEGWEVPKFLEAMADAPDFYFDSISQIRMDKWSNGRVALVGDAAYCASPASGQGTSLALVGAYVLAGEIAAAGGDTSGFEAYERQLGHFVSVNQKLGPSNIKQMVLRSKMQVRMAMTFMSLMSRMPGKDRMTAKIVETIHQAATAITLKDY